MTNKCEDISGKVKRARMHPSMICRRVFSNAVSRLNLVTPWCGRRWRAVYFWHVGAKYSTLKVSAARCYQYIVWMPVETKCCRANLLLNVFRHPKTLVLFVVTHTNTAVATTHSEFLLIWTPFDAGGCTVYSKHD